MYDVMLDEANLWFHEPPLRNRKLQVAPVYSPPSPVEEEEEEEEEAHSSDEDMDPVEREKYRLQVVVLVESCGFDVDYFNHIFNGIVPSGCSCYDTLFAKAGLHCYNIEKGKKLEESSKSERRNQFTLQLLFNIRGDGSGQQFTPYFPNHGHGGSDEEESTLGSGDATVFWDFDAIDDFYKGDMPGWPADDGGDKLDLYEVKGSEFQDNEWLYLYAEAALFSEWHCDMSDYMPFEMKQVMVQTKEDVESSMKLIKVGQCNLLHEFQGSWRSRVQRHSKKNK